MIQWIKSGNPQNQSWGSSMGSELGMIQWIKSGDDPWGQSWERSNGSNLQLRQGKQQYHDRPREFTGKPLCIQAAGPFCSHQSCFGVTPRPGGRQLLSLGAHICSPWAGGEPTCSPEPQGCFPGIRSHLLQGTARRKPELVSICFSSLWQK